MSKFLDFFKKEKLFFLCYTVQKDFNVACFQSFFELNKFIRDLKTNFDGCDICINVYKGERIK